METSGNLESLSAPPGAIPGLPDAESPGPAGQAAAALVAGHAPEDDLPLTVIERKPGWKFIDLGEMWRYRELLYFLVWRDVKVRYKQTVLGAAWAVLQPLATMVVFSLFFGRVAGVAVSEFPYPLFVYAGLLPWSFLATSVAQAGQSIVGSQNLVTKVYFPRLFIPLGTIGAALVDFGVAFLMLLCLMLWYGVAPAAGMLAAPPLVLLLVLCAMGVGTLLATLTVAYRDFRYMVPFLVQIWLFSTPAIYMNADALGPRWQRYLPLNPAYGIIVNFRAAMLGTPWDLYALSVSTAVGAAIFLTAAFYFRRVERSFADII